MQTTNKRTIGVFGLTSAIIGLVVGGGLFVLPGELATKAGPAVLLSFVIASLVAGFFCVIAAELGAVFPVRGSTFVILVRMFSAREAFLVSCMLVAAFAVTAAFLANACINYLFSQSLDINLQYYTILLITVFAILNLTGTRSTVFIQAMLVTVIIVVLGAFIIKGAAAIELQHFTPVAPKGWWPAISAAIPAYFAFIGFNAIIEIGGEIKSPAKTLPVAIMVSFSFILFIYCAVTVTLLGTNDISTLATLSEPMISVANQIAQSWLSLGVLCAAVAAFLTTLNAVILLGSRELYALSKSGLLPEALAVCVGKHKVPFLGVLIMWFLSISVVLVDGDSIQYASLTVLAMLFQQSFLALAYLRLSSHEVTAVKSVHSPVIRYLFGIGTIVSSWAMIVIGVADDQEVLITAVLFVLLTLGLYGWRESALRKRGGHMQSMIAAYVNEEKVGID